ncbi:MAG: DUF255 domain-containing protein [Candidatus Eisenbacteria bacterium]|nr:DUF255 domain-containing protein [Candidatus Latescibacterota bacterium]MBD3301842.1 DUF255 domain-containing protein [Candidatus Eisenbacteria bacterium]
MQHERKPNRLIHEKSPYLKQHARNPVDWYPWGTEALQRSRTEDRPIFLSIGYSACHWCHVMESESFEDPEIAALMNERFVNVKVDREERPDLDRIYMTAVQMLTGAGGWPMSVFLTPDLRPFYGGTYFPPEDRFGRPGFPRVLQAVAEAYRSRRDEVERASSEITDRIRSLGKGGEGESLLSPVLLDQAAEGLARSFDGANGGFGGAPKFPQSLLLQVLMRRSRSASDLEATRMVRRTLGKMAAGGIYDQIGGGFHRYATDERWLVPHFEKMLYDNALLAIAYLEAHQLYGEADDARVARETLGYIAREMRDPNGGFYAAQDADSEGKEGLYYTWRPDELKNVLGAEDAELFARAYDVEEAGNFEGRSILHRVKGDEVLAGISGSTPEEVRERLSACAARLLEARRRRVPPLRDEKVLVDWNGLAISAFARGSRVLADPVALRIAGEAAAFLLEEARGAEGRLRHVWIDGEARIDGLLEDYAALIPALVDLYEAGGEARWIQEAEALAEIMIDEFADANGGFYDTRADRDDLIARTQRPEDGSIPSGNSLAAYGLLRLGRLTGREDLLERAAGTLRAFAGVMRRFPSATAQMLLALDLHLSEPREVAVVGGWEDPAAAALRRVVDAAFLPDTVTLHGSGEGEEGSLRGLRGKHLVGGRPAAYVCRSFTCREPVTRPEELEEQLRA